MAQFSRVDPKLAAHSARIVDKLVTTFMRKGEKASARKVVNKAFTVIAEKTSQRPDMVLLGAVVNAAPPMKLRSMKRGARKVRIPSPVTEEEQQNLGIKFIVDQALKRDYKRFSYERLASEILAACEEKGAAVEKKRTIIKQLEDSRGNINLRR